MVAPTSNPSTQERQKQEDCKFEIRVDYRASSRQVSDTDRVGDSKRRKRLETASLSSETLNWILRPA